jgi:hypothetical protein
VSLVSNPGHLYSRHSPYMWNDLLGNGIWRDCTYCGKKCSLRRSSKKCLLYDSVTCNKQFEVLGRTEVCIHRRNNVAVE